MAASSRGTFLLHQYYHAVLPRDVPGQEDKHLYLIDVALLDRLVGAVKAITPLVPLVYQPQVNAIRLTLTSTKSLNVEGKIDKNLLIKELRELEGGQALILHVTEQNAALLLYRHTSSSGDLSVVFEAFETSPVCEKVLASEGALQWEFPGQAVLVPYNVFSDEQFQDGMTTFLEQASIESVKQFAAITQKAAAPLPEIRDTADPTLVTGLFMTILEANGQVLIPTSLRKRVRDTVSFKEAHKPWRRSPFYLTLRVALQRRLYALLGPDAGRVYYKILMCMFLVILLDESRLLVPHEAVHYLRQKLGRRLAKLEMDRGRATKAAREAHDHLFGSLRLLNSSPALDRAFYKPLIATGTQSRSAAELLGRYESTGETKSFYTIVKRYLEIREFEEEVVEPNITDNDLIRESDHHCIGLARSIRSYVKEVQDVYDDYPILKTIASHALLGEYHPGFEATMLDVLQLSSLHEMERLQNVQMYISQRCRGWRGTGTKTIFGTPHHDSFAVRWFDASPVSKQLLQRINEEAANALAAKEKEWTKRSSDHEQLIRQVAELSCVYVTEIDEFGHTTRTHKKGCQKHRLKWQAKQINIRIHEHPLPTSEPAAKAAVFELICPETFAAYRDATWLILSSFAYPKSDPLERVPLVRAYPGLRKHAVGKGFHVTLGSTTKSHLDSHYATSDFPVTFPQICLPFGLKLDYYDSFGNTWTLRKEALSFARHFPLKLPLSSPYSNFQRSYDDWPSSNKIISSQTKCPSDLNVHEFMAWQGLLAGTYCRWLCLMRELASTSLNFSTESTWAIVLQLILEAGPASSEDRLRDVHSVFSDHAFCKKILEQVSHRFIAIRRNWREAVQMDMLISILLKVISFASAAEVRDEAAELLGTARTITWGWYSALQSLNEGQAATHSVFAIWAAALCKRTFYSTLESMHNIDRATLQSYISASIALQNHLVGQFEALPYNLRNAVLQDLISTHGIRYRLQDALMRDSHALLAALNEIWPVPQEFMDGPGMLQVDGESWWAFTTLSSTRLGITRYIHYNLVYGTLLIDGQQLGMLPAEYRHWPIIQELFGLQHLQVYPSTLRGMSLIVTQPAYGHYVHLGFRDGALVIRTTLQDTTLELIPRGEFKKYDQFDLPASLLAGCFHWLDLKTGILEIRRDNPWKQKNSNWRLDIRTRRAVRNNGSMLVDPHSDLAQKVAYNFKYFEYPQHITVYQPPKENMRVELKRLELDFKVNRDHLLQCPQLGAEIVETKSQDPGTWYGLHSKIVLRSIKNKSQRSILVPIGNSVQSREGQHVSIRVQNQGQYLKFAINDVLGRIECPAEPRLLYTKALWHASTSHFLPDSLTGRTGVEEALSYLQTGAYWPWTTLQPEVADLLLAMANLSPRRVYYPTSLRSMETVSWNPNLTTTIQDDRFRNLVEKICKRNADLTLFSGEPELESPSCALGDIHLESRAMCRAYAHRPRNDEIYLARDSRMSTTGRANVTEVSQLLSDWPSKLANTAELASILAEIPIIGGYAREFDKIQLTDLLNVELGMEWGALAYTAKNASKADKFQLMFLFSTMTYLPNARIDLIRVLVSYAVLDDLKSLLPPATPSFARFQLNEVPNAGLLAELMKKAEKPFVASKQVKSNDRGQLALGRVRHGQEATDCREEFAESLWAQWPRILPDLDILAETSEAVLDRDEALACVLPEWTRLAENFEFYQYIQEVQLVLNRHGISSLYTRGGGGELRPKHPPIYPLGLRGDEAPSLSQLLQKDLKNYVRSNSLSMYSTENIHKADPSALLTLPNGPRNSSYGLKGQPPHPTGKDGLSYRSQSHINELDDIVATFQLSSSSIRKRYGVEMQQSIEALREHIAKPRPLMEALNPTQVEHQILAARAAFHDTLNRVTDTLRKKDKRAQWLQHAGIWPRMTPVTLLTELRSTSGVNFGDGTKQALVDLGLAITNYQRLLRIKDAANSGKRQQLFDERENPGHQNWSPYDQVDWLLLEVEGDIMLRAEQVDVAYATISPASGQNSVLQLLMGKGKTSCILPMVALVLADKRHLFRIVVPRPLLLQSAQVLQTKLGGLLNREVMHIPFSRKTRGTQELMQTYCKLHSHIEQRNGVILALPEHLLSFRLSGLQRLCDGRNEEATIMIRAQEWLDRHARDVLDECDVSLAIRTQLIYPSGSQTTVDGHPLRWQTIQAVLRLIQHVLPGIHAIFPQSLEIVHRPLGDYPLIYFLRRDVEEHLVAQIIQLICKGQTTILPSSEICAASRKDVEDYISCTMLEPEVVDRVKEAFRGKAHVLNVLRHLRGLFVHRILVSTLKKRWNVQYGLHPARDPMAVPYQAKGVPSPFSEWGHPDVAIILTCLSFYYQGLNIAQFKQAFEQLLKSDEPSIGYETWASKELPEGLRDHNAINVEDSSQLHELHRYVRHNVYLLDFYLNTFVFPRHAKQFHTKLQASGWDLVLHDPSRQSNSQTTGFSGTNDSRHQLPMMIEQKDLRNLAHTNAEVLSYLLVERNRRYVQMVDKSGKRLSEEGLLKKLLNPLGVEWPKRPDPKERIRILIDAGAQILEHDNRSLARAWLKIDHQAAAAVYFDSDHRARVVYGKGTDLPLVASSFAENLEECLVYLDESHCRGTDLKLPPNARAALTLGPHLSKDALAQAAMRLRLLGQSQSVTFFSPPEVHQGILDLRKAGSRHKLDSYDVIRWLLEQTCNGIEQLEPLYFNQGNSYLQRAQTKLDNPDYVSSEADRRKYVSVMQTKELQTLKQLYEPKGSRRIPPPKLSSFAPSLRGYVQDLHQRKRGFEDRGIAVQSSALEEVEQEREMEFEVESVREVQPPVHATALKTCKLHKDIECFATTGQLPAGSDAYLPMFCALQNTALGCRHGGITAATQASSFFVSTQFTRTAQAIGPNDNFLRPCQWVVWSRGTEIGLVVSPEEANFLIPILRKTRFTETRKHGTHLIVYAAPVTRRMLHFNDLDFHATPSLPPNFRIPTWFKVELGIFAGRLYFNWDEYSVMLQYLGVENSREETAIGRREAFAEKPLSFLHDWLAVRRKGQDFEHTPMGFVTTGKPLSSEHPFFLTADGVEEVDKNSQNGPVAFASNLAEEEESDDEDDHKDQLFRAENGKEDGDRAPILDEDDDHSHDSGEGDNYFDAGEYVEEEPDKED
ncbi:hypothetical protein BDV95DRAFT_493867 [Massariosphaeria phaeospora]|uniref:ubiquitinyl hydrolase 1 n=1 Tax=Massariosphaeria phaeospora TaxID=100035 RepID=A0A7C8M7Y4_9PLEO|nr:hypothetical protein BDV95DRAFT_493867 [Massariosphaeria phaeospora]